MKYLNIAKYRLFDMKDSIIIYYIIMLIIQLGKCIIIIRNKDVIILPEIFISTAIFLFVAGLNSFKPQLKFLCQNGFTRQNIHFGFVAVLPFSILIAVIDYAVYSIQLFADFLSSQNSVHITNYNPFEFHGEFSAAQAVLITLISSALLYAAALSLGYMISALFYRLNKIGKILVAVAVPAAITFTAAMESIAGLEGIMYYFIKSVFFGSPYDTRYSGHFIIVLILSIILCLSASRLLIRKAIIKE